MKKLTSTLLVLLAASTGASTFAADKITPGTYKVDVDHSKVGFSISHLVVSTVDGVFTDYQSEFTVGKKFEDLQISTSINTASISTGVTKRDEHLKSPDFFDAAKFPKITFKSKRISGPADHLRIVGDLTIKDKTKEVTLNGKYSGSVNDPWGNERAVFKADGKISRKDFGLSWNQLIEKGPVVGDEVTLSISVEGIKNK